MKVVNFLLLFLFTIAIVDTSVGAPAVDDSNAIEGDVNESLALPANVLNDDLSGDQKELSHETSNDDNVDDDNEDLTDDLINEDQEFDEIKDGDMSVGDSEPSVIANQNSFVEKEFDEDDGENDDDEISNDVPITSDQASPQQSSRHLIRSPSKEDNINEYPIIGILAQETSFALEQRYPGQYKSFIAASYVKFVEGGGARVVPIWINKPKSYYRKIMKKINGVLFPGGATWFNQSNGYADAGWHIYQIAKDLNDRGEYFPIWGACLGFELLTYLDSNRLEHRDDCQSQNQALNLDFKKDFLQSRLFGDASKVVTLDLAFRPVTSNFHRYCVTEQALVASGIADNWHVLSTNRDWDGFTFISSLEHVNYPFYGVQFHPEKNIYEWVRGKNITHTRAAIRANQYFAQFFVNEARKSNHSFIDKTDEYKHLIYNFPTTFTALRGVSYEECYMFRAGVNYPSVSTRPSATDVPDDSEN